MGPCFVVSFLMCFLVEGQVKKNSVFQVAGLKILGRVGRHFFSGKKNIILCILKGILPFKMHKIIFF